MNRREFLQASGIAVLTAKSMTSRASDPHNLAGQVPAGDGGTDQPDVLVLLTDQWNPRCIGYGSDAGVKTPHLDRLAEEGMIFDNTYTSCPVCMPARASLITGLYPHQHNLWGNSREWYVFPHMAPMFSDIRNAQVTTAQIGKLHWTGGANYRREFANKQEYYKALGLDYCMDIATPFTTNSKGDDPYCEHVRELGLMAAYEKDMTDRLVHDQYIARPSVVRPEDHNDSFVADEAIEFIRRQPQKKPFCLVVSFPGPHTPLDAPGKYAEMYNPETVQLPPNVPDVTTEMDNRYSKEDIKRLRANYYGKISLIDDNVGRIIDEVKKRGNWENTLIIFTSDHGEMIGAHGKMSKGKFLEESSRVPLFMRWPARIKAGQRSSALAQVFDVYPTIVEAVGGKLSTGHSAVSLLPVAEGEKRSVRNAVYSEIRRKGHLNYMVRDERYKWYAMAGQEYLFDLENDPYEMNNLIASTAHQPIIQRLKETHYGYLMSEQYDYSANYVPLVQRTIKQQAAH
jgi:arylsulfatase A-like enzyme